MKHPSITENYNCEKNMNNLYIKYGKDRTFSTDLSFTRTQNANCFSICEIVKDAVPTWSTEINYGANC